MTPTVLRFLAPCVALLASVALPCVVHADGIPPAPPCPVGTTTRSCHGPSYCQPLTCTADSDCSGGSVCRDVSYCIASSYCSGGRPPPDAAPSGFATTSATRVCADGCLAGETCTPSRVCVPPGASAGPVHATYCGCRAAGAGPRDARALAATIVALLAIVTRRGAANALRLRPGLLVRR